MNTAADLTAKRDLLARKIGALSGEGQSKLGKDAYDLGVALLLLSGSLRDLAEECRQLQLRMIDAQLFGPIRYILAQIAAECGWLRDRLKCAARTLLGTFRRTRLWKTMGTPVERQ